MGFFTAGLEPYEQEFRRAAAGMELAAVISRIWRKDPTVWKKKDVEISDRLGWLEAPENAAGSLPEIEAFVGEVREAGYEHALVLGMGGSSLAPEVFSRIFGKKQGYLTLDILDSTDPEAVLSFAETLPCEKTIYIVSSKSGTTLETTSFLNFFYKRVRDGRNRGRAGAHFAAITDPGTPLEWMARDLGFRRVFHGDPDVGGRFSVLSAFGLIPAALLGMDVAGLLARGRQAARECRNPALRENPGASLGLLLGVLAKADRDKIAFLLSPRIEAFGAWIEQLLAESTGKDGRGILPLVRDAGLSFAKDVSDRVTVHIGMAGDETHIGTLRKIAKKRLPFISVLLEDVDDLGYQFFLWEMATAVAGHILKVNPFDQPNVAASKKKTEAVLKAYRKRSRLPAEKPAAAAELRRFLSRAKAGDYVAVQAFLPPEPKIRAGLQEFAAAIGARTGRPVTYDFGPRFLHSTGQLHKGDQGNGLFVQLTAGHGRDADVPDEPGSSSSSFTFGALIDAQAKGDREALREKGRRIIHLHLGGQTNPGIRRLTEALKKKRSVSARPQ